MLFLSLEREIDTTFALETAFSEEKTVLVPKVIWEDSKIVPVRLASLDDACEPDRYGLRNPIQAETVPAGEIDLVIVPGLAFDTQAKRLGRGGGFYDRFLADPALGAGRCGLAFHEQLLPEVPAESNDQSVDGNRSAKIVFHIAIRGKELGCGKSCGTKHKNKE